jgi:hypothetical protein
LIVPGIGLLAAMIAAWWIGQAIFRRRQSPANGERASESYVLSGVFGLLALLMAFAFSLAIGRFESRRLLVVEEANAIGTMSTRLALLEDAQRAPLARELAVYARARAAAGLVPDETAWQAAHERTTRICARYGDSLFAMLRSMPPDTRGPMLVQAYNAMCDVTTSRHAARKARLPSEVMLLLALYCCAGAAMLGYSHGSEGGSEGQRHALPSILFFALLAAAFTTILDLDNPRGGAILVPQDELESVARGLT